MMTWHGRQPNVLLLNLNAKYTWKSGPRPKLAETPKTGADTKAATAQPHPQRTLAKQRKANTPIAGSAPAGAAE